MQGVSLVPTLEDEGGNSHTPPHEFVVSGRSMFIPLSAKPTCTVTDGQWTLIHGGNHAPSALYFLPDDPRQQTNLLDQRCNVAIDLQTKLVAFLESTGTAQQQIEPWRAAPCAAR